MPTVISNKIIKYIFIVHKKLHAYILLEFYLQ